MYYNRLIHAVLLAMWGGLEGFRLYFGYKGNLQETVPDTSTFLLMSVFPQLPIVCYLAYFQPVLFPVDYVVGSLMLIILVNLLIKIFVIIININEHL